MLDFQICNEKIVDSKLPECVLPKAQVALFSCVTGRMGGGGGGGGGRGFIYIFCNFQVLLILKNKEWRNVFSGETVN